MKRLMCAAVLAACTVMMSAQVSTTTVTKATGKDGKPLPSPRMLTKAKVGPATIEIDYGAPSVKGRTVFYDLVPQDKIWRTGANEATGFKTSSDIMLGSLHVPAGSYTLFTLPTTDGWLLVVNKQTGQWGLTYDEKQDLGRTKLVEGSLPVSQEQLSITVEQIKGKQGMLHIRWANKDLSAVIAAH